MNKEDIEIIGATTCGTYPSWTDYTIASFYNHVDKIIVINAGYDIDHPEKGAIIPLEREHKLIYNIDIKNKIIEISPTQEMIDNLYNTLCIREKDEFGRATNITLSSLSAYNLPNPQNKSRYIIKIDNDQIFYPITREQLINLINQYSDKKGFRFAQYAGYYNDFKHVDYIPDEFTNDGALFYYSLPGQSYCGQGSPGNIKVDQYPIYSIRTAHMRRISPPGIDAYEYHYKRLWYHTYGPNSIMEHDYNRKTGQKLTNGQIKEIAYKEAISILQDKNKPEIDKLPYDERIPYQPPLVCTMGPLEYIKKGY